MNNLPLGVCLKNLKNCRILGSSSSEPDQMLWQCPLHLSSDHSLSPPCGLHRCSAIMSLTMACPGCWSPSWSKSTSPSSVLTWYRTDATQTPLHWLLPVNPTPSWQSTATRWRLWATPQGRPRRCPNQVGAGGPARWGFNQNQIPDWQ